jgi:serine/threonine protein kinase
MSITSDTSNAEPNTKKENSQTKRKMTDKQSIPKVIGGYQIIEILGEGGMSVVYTAMQEHPRRKVAVKVLRGGMYSPTAVKRFHQEVEILGKLDHPWIAKIYDAGAHDDGNGATPYYVMEHVEGARELTDFLEEASLEQRDVLKLFAMITSAVEHGHHRGIVHRDLKPGNILIDPMGEPKIIDFGVARSLDRNTVSEEAMTEAGRLVGTVQFMAPEQVDPNVTDIDARCDVYALGAVVYQMLTNRLPRTLEGLPIYEAVRQICQEDPIRPSTYVDSIDSDLEAIIMMALETNREKRYQTAGSFGRDILRYLGNRTIKAKKATPSDHVKLFCRRHKKQILVWSLLTVATAIAVSSMFYLRAESNQHVGDLRAEVDAVRKENAELKQATPAKPEEVDEVKARLILTLPSEPRQTVVSEDGQTLAAIVGDDYYATSLIPRSIPLPPINIEPSKATIGLSPKGTRLAVVSERRCRLVLLGQRKPSLQLAGDFSNVSAMAVGEAAFAIAGHDMSLQVSVPRKQLMRTTSITGIYKAISFGSTDTQLLAATDHWVYFWKIQDFPKNARKLQGVNDPCLIRGFNQRLVVVGRSGQIVIHEPNKKVNPVESLQLESKIEQCAMNKETTLLAYISNGKAYLHTIATGKTQELTWIPEIPVGIAIGEINELIVWTEDGKVYRR